MERLSELLHLPPQEDEVERDGDQDVEPPASAPAELALGGALELADAALEREQTLAVELRTVSVLSSSVHVPITREGGRPRPA